MGDEIIYNALNAVEDITNRVYWVFINDEDIDTSKQNPTAVVTQTDRDNVSTFAGPTSVRSSYVIDYRGENSGRCKEYLDNTLSNLSGYVSTYTLVDVGFDTELEKTILRAVITLSV